MALAFDTLDKDLASLLQQGMMKLSRDVYAHLGHGPDDHFPSITVIIACCELIALNLAAASSPNAEVCQANVDYLAKHITARTTYLHAQACAEVSAKH